MSSIRGLLASLDALPVLRVPGRLLYRANVQFVATVCRSIPGVRTLYATGSMASGDIVPGLSDIDLVVVIRDLPFDRELRLIRRLETTLRFIVPPLGEAKSGTHLMIYSTAEWETVGSILLGKRSGRPTVVFDRRETPREEVVNPRVHSLHHLLKAKWRLDVMQNRLAEPCEDRLDALLRRRMVDRLVGALENACTEDGASLEHHVEVFALAAEIRLELGRSRARPGEPMLPWAMPRILACFDLAMRHGLPACPSTEAADPFADAPYPEACANAAESVELARTLRAGIGDRLGDHLVWVARIGGVDFVVCDPLAQQPVRNLVEYNLAHPERTMRILSPRMLSRLYLSDEIGHHVFVRLDDMRSFVAEGCTSPERWLLEAYTMFPRVRALHKLENAAVFDTYRTGIVRLLDHFQGVYSQTGNSPEDHIRRRIQQVSYHDSTTAPGHADNTQSSSGSGNAAGFRELRRLSYALLTTVKRSPSLAGSTG